MAPVICRPDPTTSSPAIVKIVSCEKPVTASFIGMTWQQTSTRSAVNMIVSEAYFSWKSANTIQRKIG